MKKSIRNERITNNVPRVALIRSKKYPFIARRKYTCFSNHFGHVPLYLYQYSVIRARSSTILHFFSIFASRVYRLFSFHIIRHFPSIFLLPLSPITIFKWDDSQEYFAENKFKNFPVQFLFCDFSISSDFFIFKTDSPLFFLPPCPLFSKNIR